MFRIIRILLSLFFIYGCASAAAALEVSDDSTDKPIVSETAVAADKKSLFASVTKKMTPDQVVALLGAPNKISSGQSGKQWIPFYFGADTRRVYWSYSGIGIVVFSENAYRGSLTVVDIRYDAAAL